ncbi:PD-(D/E)XK nuclease family protein [Nitrospira sp. NS4]|uniref:PD-(D/E)XK nuclease family protein n=1 Tax=Nitrospira sp. NS4 TaxID=3414498 RepID=UPI003C2B8981
MLRVVTGPFHPHLESALVEQIRLGKSSDPFAPLAVLVPSTQLLDRLRRLLTVEHRLSLLNIHFLTFHQLALRLADEARAGTQIAPLRVVDDLFFEQLVRHIVHSRLSSLAPLRHIGHSSGTWGALWSTVRDLKDAGVQPAEALRGLNEGYFEKEDQEWLQALFSLHAAIREVGKTLAVGTPDDLAESLIPLVETSPFLRSLRHVLYYGFYDLTQVQLSLFEAVSATVSTTLFFPLEEGSQSGFARRFFDRYIRARVATPDVITRLPAAPVETGPNPVTLSVQSVIGVEEELASVCRTILDLVETNGYRFDEIGVVARTLDPYRAHLQTVFGRHRVPLTTNAGRPLIQEPLCKALLQLADLPMTDFYRTTVLDVVTSPLYATALIDEASAHYRPEQWKLIAQALQITRGVEEWRRVEEAARSTMELESGEEGDGVVDALGIAPEVIALFWEVLSQLLAECRALPERGTVGQLVEAFQKLVEQRLRHPDAGAGSEPDEGAVRLTATWDALDHMWSRLRELDAIGEELAWPAFVELLTHAIERTVIPLETTAHQGVMVLDVMAARGVPFNALFILGLNEKVFPRYIREDAFLRDRHRRVLDATLGFKIDEKLGGYDEEALLFALLCRAANRRLYLSYQRADDAGRMQAPSPYLAEASRLCGGDARPVEVIPRRLTDRVAQRPSIRDFLAPSDLAQWMAIGGQDPENLLRAVGSDAEAFRHALRAQARIEDETPGLNDFDGITGPLEAHWSRVVRRGLAPTPLERYARCPFQYFASDVLRLEPIRLAISQEPDAALLGTLCHAALRRCYEQLLPAGWPAEPVTDDTVEWCIHSAVEEAAKECEARHRTGHYLLWELAKEQIAALLTDSVDADQGAQAQEPYSPIAFEVDAEGTLADVMSEEPGSLKIHGRVDRIDRHRITGAIRIIDYKFKTGSAMKPEDRNLLQSAARGYRLQPPLYARLRIPDQPQPGQVQFVFLAPHWSTPIARSTFETGAWSSEVGTLLHRTISLLVKGIHEGRYFIQPDSYCETCEFRVVCRQDHRTTWWRSYRSDDSKALKALRTQRIKEESRGTDS